MDIFQELAKIDWWAACLAIVAAFLAFKFAARKVNECKNQIEPDNRRNIPAVSVYSVKVIENIKIENS